MIIVLNGPPGVGKDTLAGLLCDKYNIGFASFKQPMWDITKAVLGEEIFREFTRRYHTRELKEAPWGALGGLSPRGFFIHISESWCKPLLGDKYFGEQLKAATASGNFIVADGGFPEELVPSLLAGAKVIVVRLHREGFTFDGDSRNYVKEEQLSYLPAALLPLFIDFEVTGQPVESAEKLSNKLGLVHL